MQLRQQSTTYCRSSARRGVTSIELVITVMIIGIIAAVATPRFTQFYRTERLNAAGRRVAADLNLARSWAATTSSPQTVTFSLANHGYIVSGGLEDPQRPGKIFETRLNTEPYWSRIFSVNFDSLNVVSFNGAGLPSSGGTIVIGNKPQAITIVVDPVTGKATVNQ